MRRAKILQKEKAFYINVPIKEIYKEPDLEGDILVQGIIDLYFVDENDNLVLLDYKTDYVENEQEDLLIKKYKIQLDLYDDAIEKLTGKEVKEKCVYLFGLDEGISI